MKKTIKILSAFLFATVILSSCGNNNTNVESSVSSNKAEVSEVTQENIDDREVFVDADYVKDVIDGKKNIGEYLIAEVTWGEAKDSPDYLKEHIKGAIHINTDSVEEGPIWNLRKPEELEANMLKYGIKKDKTIILYGPDTGVTRVAFAYKYAGVDHVKILNGGLKAWKDKGFETEKEEVKPTAEEKFGTKVPAHPEYVLSLDETKDKLENDENFQLISVRSEKEWKGIESGYNYIPKAGEPKGAIWGKAGSDSANMQDYMNEDGTYKSYDDVAKMWDELGISTEKEMSFYCGTGWRATLPWFIAYQNGLNPTVFDGGWNEWQMHDELPVQVGDPKDSNVEYTTVKELPNDRASK